MVEAKALKKSVKAEVDALLPRLVEMSDWIGTHPELGSEEVEAAKLLSGELEKHGIKVERGALGMPTAFRGVVKGKGKGPTIAIFCEYDALPGVGHGCGHNLIGTIGLGAGIALSKLMKDLPGELWVVGSPAEEGHGPSAGAKRKMAEAGYLKGVDVAMMIHPTTGPTSVSMGFLAVAGSTIEFQGKTAHAAGDPQNGANALNAAVLCYMAIHANRQQLRRDANAVVHGIITEGGLASNIIPDRAVLRFGVRSSDSTYVPTLLRMVENAAKGAALATGCEVKVTSSGSGMRASLHVKPLESLLVKEFNEVGVEVEAPDVTRARPPGGSTDFADTTHFIPGIHPMLSIHDASIAMHSREVAACTLTEAGHKALEQGAKTLAIAAIDLFTDAKLLAEVKDAWAALPGKKS